MRHPLSPDQVDKEIFAARHTAWRWEQQPSYHVASEQPALQSFLNGHPVSPDRDPVAAAWLDRMYELTHRHGVHVTRVRVADDPPTDYQRWLQWVDRWNRGAGEDITYLPRSVLHTWGGYLPVEPGADWWLLDDQRLLVQRYPADGGELTAVELITDEPVVRLARLWWLAVFAWATAEDRPAA